MKNLKLIIAREYVSRVQKKSFLLLTLLTPFIFVGIFAFPLLLSGIQSDEAKKIIVIDQTGLYDNLKLENFEGYEFESIGSGTAVDNRNSETFAVLQITDNLTKNPKAVTIFSEKQTPTNLLNYLDYYFSEVVKNQQLTTLSDTQNIHKETLNQVQVILASKIKVTNIKWTDDGKEQETSSQFVSIVAMVFSLLLYTFVATYGAMVMQGIIEEKSNRIVEVMISSVRPFDLMMGKIIGIGLVGLTQMLIWGIIMGTGVSVMQSMLGQNEGSTIQEMLFFAGNVNWAQLVSSFLIYFIGGYLIYASTFAMFGSTVDNPQDAQQFVFPVTLLLMFALYAGIYSTSNPDVPLAVWTSIIPFTSPVVMINRVAFGVSTGELILSMSLLIATSILMIYLAARIYRIGIFMYGKKPSIKEISKWLFYK